MAGDPAAWIKQMAQVFGGGGGTGLLPKGLGPDDDAADTVGNKGAKPADENEKDEDEAPDETAKGGGGGGGAPAGGGAGGSGGASGGGGGGDAGGPSGGGKGGGAAKTGDAKGGAPAGDPGAGNGDGKPKSGGDAKGDPAGATGGGDPGASSGASKSGDKSSDAAKSPKKLTGYYTTAKEAANAAQEYLKEFDALSSQLKSAEAELKKHIDDAQASAKEIQAAEKAAAEAVKSIPAPATVGKPTGDTPQPQYDSAIQIKGDVVKVQQDAQGKIDAVAEQRDATREKSSAIENSQKLAAAGLEKFKSLKIDAEVYSEGAVSAASDAQTLAEQAKEKAEQAEKDKSVDADKLKTSAKEEAQSAAAAKETGGKVQAAAKPVIGGVAKAEEAIKSLEKMAQESRTALDARKQQVNDANQKLQSHTEAVQKAEIQEQECKDKLSKEDADAVLIKRYESLGGDAELKKALEAQDKAFETESEKFRTQIKKWHDDTVRQLDDYKQELEPALKRSELDTPKWDEWIKREEPIAQKMTADVNALGDKLKVEKVKELASEVQTQTASIADTKRWNEEDKEVLVAMKEAKHALDERYRAADAELSAGEKYVNDSRTELNNELEMQNMTLEQKVNFLQYQPKIVRDRYQKRMESEIERLVRENASNREAQITKFESKIENYPQDPIDWKPLQDKLAEFQKASLEELQSKDDDVYEIEQKYNAAGGDEALFKKRMDVWNETMRQADDLDKQQFADDQKRSEQLRREFDAAAEREKEMKETAKAYKALQKQQKERFEELQKKDATGLTDTERAEYKLLERSLQNLNKRVDNMAGEEVMRSFSKNTSGALAEAQKKLANARKADYQKLVPKPTSEEIHQLPVKQKYTELTGQSV